MALTKQMRQSARLKTHNQGVLDYLLKVRVKTPPKGWKNNLPTFYRAGWMSAKAAVEGTK